MSVVCGVYGYQITVPIEVGGMKILPLSGSYKESKGLARDLASYNLTGILVAEKISADLIFDLEAVLSFIERLDVLITMPEIAQGSDLFELFPKIITTRARASGGGCTVGDDAFFPGSRRDFIEKALGLLEGGSVSESSRFRSLLFKYVETFRQRNSFIEVSYFLLYSGIESFSRSKLDDKTNKNSAVPIAKLLVSYGFDVAVDKPKDLARAMTTYTKLRNSLFHNDELTVVIKIDSESFELSLVDYFFNLSQLVSLVVLKAVDFDDGRINWDSWIDRHRFLGRSIKASKRGKENVENEAS